MFTTLNSQIETSGMQFLDVLVATVSNRHQTISAYLKVRTFCFADVDKSARCVIQEIEEVFENRAHSCWIFKKLIIDCHLSTLHTPYYKHFLNLSQAIGRYFLRLSLVKITWIWQALFLTLIPVVQFSFYCCILKGFFYSNWYELHLCFFFLLCIFLLVQNTVS